MKAVTITGVVHQNARIQIVPLEDTICSKHAHWTFTNVEDALEIFLDRMAKLLQSNDIVYLEDILFETTVILNNQGGAGKSNIILDEAIKNSIIPIVNKDTLCQGRAIVTAIASNKELQLLYHPNLNANQIKYI